MIPDLDPETGFLPFKSETPIETTLVEVRDRFAVGTHRERIWRAFCDWLDALDVARFPGSLRLAGGFVSASDRPSDIDVAVAVPADQVSVAGGMVGTLAHLWTWQNIGLQDAITGDWKVKVRRLQPALGLVDAHYFQEGSAKGALLAHDWTSEFDSGGEPTGVRKGWLEVKR